MLTKRIVHCALLAFACLAASLPGQAAMVATTQMQSGAAQALNGDVATQRDWIVEQLVAGGVAADDASARVAAMTDAQVRQLHQRIEDHPAGANGEVLVILILVLVITELMGYTDIIPGWPADTAN